MIALITALSCPLQLTQLGNDGIVVDAVPGGQPVHFPPVDHLYLPGQNHDEFLSFVVDDRSFSLADSGYSSTRKGSMWRSGLPLPRE